MHARTRFYLFLSCSIGVIGCTVDPPRAPSETFQRKYPIKATVTVGMIADLVREIGGEHVEVTQLMGAGVDPHLYKTNRDDASAISNADIVFYNGLMLEGKMAATLASFSRTKRTFAAAESLSPESLSPESLSPESLSPESLSPESLSPEILGIDPSEHSHPDPHVWMDVNLWSLVAGAIGDELAEFDPVHASDYQTAATTLRSRLKALHEYGIEVIACIPPEQRVLVTSHDAFRYFGEAYGVEVQAVQGISTESEAGLSRINELVDMLVSRKIDSIFTESSVPKDSIKALLRGAHSRGHTVRIDDASLYSDAMGEAGSYEGTYIGMMDHNLSTIARALGCKSVPANGFRESGVAQSLEGTGSTTPSLDSHSP